MIKKCTGALKCLVVPLTLNLLGKWLYTKQTRPNLDISELKISTFKLAVNEAKIDKQFNWFSIAIQVMLINIIK